MGSRWCRRCRVEGYPFCESCTDVVERAATHKGVTFEEYADQRYPEVDPLEVCSPLLGGEQLPSFPS